MFRWPHGLRVVVGLRRAEQACVALGGTLVTLGVSLVFIPAGVVVAGMLLMAAGWPREAAS